MNAINNMSEDIVTTAQTVEILLKLEKDEDRKIICAYKQSKCLMKHEDQPCFFFIHNPSEARRRPFDQGKLMYINKMCDFINLEEECPKKETCEYCHSEMELLYHPCEYKTKICDQKSHPTPYYCCFAHSEGEIRDITGYKALLPKEQEEAKELPDDNSDASSESNKQIVENVADLPLRIESEVSSGKMKKSVSLCYSGAGGIEEAMKQSKKSKIKKKNKNKSKQGGDGKSLEMIFFLDLNSFKVKQCTAGVNHNPK